MSTASRVLLHAGALGIGATAGILGSFAHPVLLSWLPIGLVCGLALTGTAFAGAGLAARSRSGTVAAVLGWLLPVLLLSAPRPEGDLVIPGSTLGYAWLLGGMVVAGLALAWRYPWPEEGGRPRPYEAAAGVTPSAEHGNGR